VTGPSPRAARALAHLGEVDPALAVLALWCRHRDGPGTTRTEGDLITYGPGFDSLALPEQVGLVAHHVLHVALRHSDRQAGLAERLGTAFDASLFGLAADSIINETLILAGHAIPRPAVTLTDLLAEAGIPEISAVAALERWDADRLAMALHSDPKRAKRLRDWSQKRGFTVDLGIGDPKEDAKKQSAADWRNQILRAFEAGRKAGTGIGRLGAILADLAPDTVPWELHLRGALARALIERPRTSWRRPSGSWVARMAEAERSGGPVPVFEPGRQRLDHRPRIVIGLDTSSSIDPQTLRLFTAEAEAIARRTGAEAHLLAFDVAVFAEVRLDPNGWNGLRDVPFRVGGGTDFFDLFEKAAKIQPSIAVILTDLDAAMPPAPGFPVLWAVPHMVTHPPYGRVIRISDAG
jgi:predicted metal-dependent peptidase